jgi:hypothetical protein
MNNKQIQSDVTALEKYAKKYDYFLYCQATIGQSCLYCNALVNEALRLCGSRLYAPIPGHQWPPEAEAFLACFRVTQAKERRKMESKEQWEELVRYFFEMEIEKAFSVQEGDTIFAEMPGNGIQTMTITRIGLDADDILCAVFGKDGVVGAESIFDLVPVRDGLWRVRDKPLPEPEWVLLSKEEIARIRF